jgi:hypothetical protein
MQRYFSLLPLDHLASTFELFLALWVFEKIFPLEADVEMFYPIVVSYNPRGPYIKKK